MNQPHGVLVDTNVLLDLLLTREPWFTAARPLWDARDASQIECYLPASVLTDVFYICRKQIGVSNAKTAVGLCLARFTLLAIDRPILEAAHQLPGTDFEDSVQIACAMRAGLNLIVTRDPRDFAHSPVPAIAPPDVVSHLLTP